MTAYEELLFWARTANHPLYERAMLEEYVKENGEHYDEHYAREAVARMYSKSGKGEHWTLDQVIDALKPYASRMRDDDTCYDAFVAFNAWWHDLGRTIPEEKLIETAFVFFFEDDDAQPGKVWRYMHAI